MSEQSTSASPGNSVQKTSASDQSLVRKLHLPKMKQKTSEGLVKEATVCEASKRERPGAKYSNDPCSQNPTQVVGDANTMVIKNIASIPLPSQPPPASVYPPKPQSVIAQPPVELTYNTEQKIASQKVKESIIGIAVPSESLHSQVTVATENELTSQNVNQTLATEEKDVKQKIPSLTQNVNIQGKLETLVAPVTANESGKVVTEIPLSHQSEGLSSLVSYSSSSSEASPAENNCVDEQEDNNSSIVREHTDTTENSSQPTNTTTDAEAESTAKSLKLEGNPLKQTEKLQDESVESSTTAIQSQNLTLFSALEKAENIPDTTETGVTDMKVCLQQGTETAVKKVVAIAVEDIEMKQVTENTHSVPQGTDRTQIEPHLTENRIPSECSYEESKVQMDLGTTQASDKKYVEGSVPDQDQEYQHGNVPDQDKKYKEGILNQNQKYKEVSGPDSDEKNKEGSVPDPIIEYQEGTGSVHHQNQKYKEGNVSHQGQKDKEDNVLHQEQKHKEDSASHQEQILKEGNLYHQEQNFHEDIIQHQEQKDNEDSIPYQEQKGQKDKKDSVVHQELENKDNDAPNQEDSIPDLKQKPKKGTSSVLFEDGSCKKVDVPQQDQSYRKDVLDLGQKVGNLQEESVTEHNVTLIPKLTVSEASLVSNKSVEQNSSDNPSVESTFPQVGMELSSEDKIKEAETIPSTKNVPVNLEVSGEQKRKLPVEDVSESTGESHGNEMEVPKKRARVEELSDVPQLLLQEASKDSSRKEEVSRTIEEETEDGYVEEESRKENAEEVRQDVSSGQLPLIGNVEVDRVESMEFDQMEKNDEESRDGLESEEVQSKDVSDDLKEKEDTKDDEDTSTPSKRRKKKKKSYERPRGEGGKFMKEKPDPSVLDEETRMDYNLVQDEDSQGSSSKREVRRFRCEVIVPESTEVFTADKVVEYVWPLEGIGEHYFIQEQISQYLGIMSFKRKYPDLRRRPIDMQERDYLKEKGLVSEIACDLGLTAVRSEDVLDVMFNDFPVKFEELQRMLSEKKENEIRERGKVNYSMANIDKSKMQEYGRKAAADAARWNANFNKEKREERRYSFDLQTFTLQMPIGRGKKLPPECTKMGWFPVSVLPGQYTDYYQEYSSQALKTMPLISVVASPVVPDNLGSDGASSESEEEGTERSIEETVEPKEEKPVEGGPRCKVCNGSKNRNKSGKPEPLIICGTCRSASHPTCIDLTLVMVPKIESYNWQCMDCKTCVTCSNPDDEDKMIFCDMCDRGYHIFCVGLRRVPNGRWHCKECAMCSSCGSKTPAGSEHLKNAEWQHEFKKDKDNKQLRYATTLCVPCDKYWKRRQFCYVCLKVYRSIPEDGMVRCSNCPKYIHREVCSTVYENERFCINCYKMRNSTALNHSRIIAAAKKKMASGY